MKKAERGRKMLREEKGNKVVTWRVEREGKRNEAKRGQVVVMKTDVICISNEKNLHHD